MKNKERLQEIFAQALKKKSRTEQERFLAEACQGDAELREQVESLLHAHEQAGNFLKQTIQLPATDFVTERTGTMIGRYKLLQKIGEGGFGAVWMAEQEEPVRRRVALKIIKAGMDTHEVVARFEAERQALALMDHPNIARVFDAGTTQAGRPYFVMELVNGIPITDYCDRERLSTAERLQLFMKVCHAVQHAHQKGIIHRDLKPNNVLVTLHDGEPVPKVIDFGVAKALGQKLTEKTLFTAFKDMIGTPAYMSPEQAELSGLDIDTRSDIYSLGVLLYELLTGETPFNSETWGRAALDEIRRIIRETEPPKPSTRLQTLGDKLTEVAKRRHTEPLALRRLVRGDLDWIVMKALEKDRKRRYETPDAFASDVARHLNTEPVIAAAPSALYLTGKFIRRHRAALATASALAVLLLAGSVVSTWQALRAGRFAREADGQRRFATNEAARALRFADESERARNQSEAGAYASRVVLASQRVEAGDLTQANRLLEACPAPLRNWEWHYLKRQSQPDFRLLHGQSNEVCRLASSPDGRWLASLDKVGRLVVWSLEGEKSQPIRIWPAMVPEEFKDDQVLVMDEAIAFSHDSRSLAYVRPVGENAWTLGLVSVGGTNSPRELLQASGEKLSPLCLSFSQDDRNLMIGCRDGVIRSYDITAAGEVASYPIMAVAFSPDGSRVVSLGVAPMTDESPAKPVSELRVFDTSTGRELVTITNLNEPGSLLSVAFSPDAKYVAAGFVEMVTHRDGAAVLARAGRGSVIIWELATGNVVLRRRLTKAAPMHLAFSVDGQQLAVACGELEVFAIGGIVHDMGAVDVYHIPHPGKIFILDVRSGEEVTTLRGHQHGVTAVAFVDGAGHLASASSGRTIRLWELGPSSVIPLGGLESRGQIETTLLSFDGRMIIVPTSEWTLGVVDLVTGRTMASVRLPEALNSGDISFASSSAGLACLTTRALHYWDLGRATEAWSLSITNLEFNPDGVVCSPDGRRLALVPLRRPPEAGPELSNIVLVEAGSGKLITRTNLPGIFSLVFSPDNRFLVAGDYDGTVHVFDAAYGARLFSRRATEPTSGVSWRDLYLNSRQRSGLRDLAVGIPVTAVAVSPDGSKLATAAGLMSAELRLWDMATEEPKWTAPLAGSTIALTFSPDGRRLAVALGNGVDALFGNRIGEPSLSREPGSVVIFEIESGQELLRISATVMSLAFSPDGMRLWGVTPTHRLVFWDASPWPARTIPPAVALKGSVVEFPDK